MSEPVRKLPGATSDALTPFSVAERSLAAGPATVALSRDDRARRRVRRPADQAHRLRPALARRVDPRRRAALDPPRPELRDRVRAVRERNSGRDRADDDCSRLDARLLRPLGAAPPGAAGRPRARDRRLGLEPDRPRPARPRDRLPRLCAGGRPSTSPIPSSASASRSSCSRSWRPTARASARAVSTYRLLVPDEAAGERLDRFLAGLPEIGSRAAAERAPRDGARRRTRPREELPARGWGGARVRAARGAALDTSSRRR